jgi:anti-sigma B factor antagonist
VAYPSTAGGQLAFEVSRSDGVCVVHVIGEVDSDTSDQLRHQLIDLIDAGEHEIVLDLSKLEFLDSTGLGVLVGAMKRLQREGSLKLRSPRPAAMKVFQITGLDGVFQFED